MAERSNWWERKGNFVSYPELRQGALPHCVYASIAGAINHVTEREVWTPTDLHSECQRRGQAQPDFGVSDTALMRVANEIEKIHHNADWSLERLTPALLGRWIDDGAVVILSMELRNDQISHQGGWHMFSLVARNEKQFQVWDTNGFRGFLSEGEIIAGFHYPNGWFFMPHDKADTLVLKRKR